VLVTSITSGNRLETYVITAPAGSGQIVINGAAAHRIGKGEMVTIMAFGQSQVPIMPKRLLMNERNEIVNTSVL
jgi:aspartate 1-decarboxylase